MSLEVKLELRRKLTINQKIFVLFPRACFSLELPVYAFVPALSNVSIGLNDKSFLFLKPLTEK